MNATEYIDHLAEERQFRPNTVANWKVAARNWERAVGEVDIGDISKKTVRIWADSLRRQHITANTANAYMRQLRSVYNKAVEEFFLDRPNPFKYVMIGPEETVKRALGELQMQRLRTMELTRREARARDVFMLTVMLRGISPCDLWGLRPKDIRGDSLTYRRAKTGRLIQMRLEPEASELMKRLGFADGSERNFRNECHGINDQLRKIGRRMGLPFGLSLYCARHTWATAAQRAGVPLSMISQSMGHADEKTTQIYLAGLETPVMDRWGRDIIDTLFGTG
ncbi:MAG: site-specific integrase [Muribaculaceae bacterium]|nr:site-specific integrase [Muribaculaceae bacterium]